MLDKKKYLKQIENKTKQVYLLNCNNKQEQTVEYDFLSVKKDIYYFIVCFQVNTHTIEYIYRYSYIHEWCYDESLNYNKTYKKYLKIKYHNQRVKCK